MRQIARCYTRIGEKMKCSIGLTKVSKERRSLHHARASYASGESLAEFTIGSNSCATRANPHPRALHRVDFVVYYFWCEFAARNDVAQSGKISTRNSKRHFQCTHAHDLTQRIPAHVRYCSNSFFFFAIR